MSAIPSIRPDLQLSAGYHSPQVEAEVRLNTNESPFPPPEKWSEDLLAALGHVAFNRYPDRPATALRTAIAGLHGVTPEEVFCANGSNEVLQCLLLAYGGPGRSAGVFEPTYALHSHISRLTGTRVIEGHRTEDFRIDPTWPPPSSHGSSPTSPSSARPTTRPGGSNPRPPSRRCWPRRRAWSSSMRRTASSPAGARSLADLRRSGPARAGGHPHLLQDLGAWPAPAWATWWPTPPWSSACEAVVLPYHLSAQTQLAGLLALRHVDEMEARVAPSPRNGAGWRPPWATCPLKAGPPTPTSSCSVPGQRGDKVWHGLLDRSVLIRNCSSSDGLEGCLRVTIGRPDENDRFLIALKESPVTKKSS